MSEHDIADCPKCSKRDFVLKEDGYWICLNCNYTQKMPSTTADSDMNFLSIMLAAFVTLLLLAAMGL